MSIVALKYSPYHKRIGSMEFKELETAPLACLAAFLRWSGIPSKLDGMLALAPVPKAGASPAMLRYVARRVGICLEPIAEQEIPAALTNGPVLVRRASGYAMILFGLEENDFVAALPGHPDSFCRVPVDSDILDDIGHAYSLTASHHVPAPERRYAPAKLFLLPWKRNYAACYDANAVVQFNRIFAAKEREQFPPAPLSELSWHALARSHRTICPSLPQYFGVSRTINLRRASLFVDAKAVIPATKSLLDIARKSATGDADAALQFAARLFVDFLTIHPFINGNRRIAMALVSRYLLEQGYLMHWDGISRAECYYWIRCASRGHFRSLLAGLGRSMAPQSH